MKKKDTSVKDILDSNGIPCAEYGAGLLCAYKGRAIFVGKGVIDEAAVCIDPDTIPFDKLPNAVKSAASRAYVP